MKRSIDRRHVTKRGRELLARKDMQPAIKLFEKATRASRAHYRLVSDSMDEYGDQGPQISGIVREHFPTDVKNRLRKLSRDINKYADAAYYARPKGVRNTTMQALAGAVATKTGTGFYGPQANPARAKGMTGGAMNKRLDALDKQSSRVTDQLIAAGRGREKWSETMRATDPLARKLQKIHAEMSNIRDEIGLRFGPGQRRAPAGARRKLKGNPTMARKKTRTAKQRAATKKMIAANRARLRKKTKTARRKTRGRKTARRKTRRNPQKARPGLTPARRAAALKRIDASKGYVVFKCAGKTVMFLLFSMTRAPHWTKDKKSAAGFRIKGKAEGVARTLIYKTGGGPKIGVAPVSMAASEIARQCQGKA